MNFNLLPGSHSSEPARNGSHLFDDWLTVSEAVAHCTNKGLSRTPKTVRKWAHLSHREDGVGDLTVRREDVDNGFRWSIERTSLDRKIDQELEFEARRVSEQDAPVGIGANQTEQVHRGSAAQYINEQARTGAYPSGDVQPSFSSEIGNEPDENAPEPVRTGVEQSVAGAADPEVITQLEARIEDLKSEVEFYRDELKDRRQTTLALTDVIEAFRLTAASNATRAQERADRRAHDIVRPTSEGDKWQSEEHGGGV